MQIEQRFELPLPPALSWPAFCNIALLVDCLPGASLTGPTVDGELPLRFDVKLGPISAGFVGTGRVSFDAASRSGRFEGAAADRKTNSRVKGVADFALADAGSGSAVTVRVDYALTGNLAQFGRGGIVRELANALTAQFAANLAARLAADTAAAQPESGDAAAAAHAAAAPGAAALPLAGGALLLRALLAWLTRVFTFRSRR